MEAWIALGAGFALMCIGALLGVIAGSNCVQSRAPKQHRHEWGRWLLTDGSLNHIWGKSVPVNVQYRTCSTCGETEVKRVYTSG